MSEEDQDAPVAEDNHNYDLIIVGTGLVESIVSCAAAKAGKRVLHMDENDVYGGSYASQSYSSLREGFKDDVKQSDRPIGDSVFAFQDSSALYHLVDSYDALPATSRLDNKASLCHPAVYSLIRPRIVDKIALGSEPHPVFLDAGQEQAKLLALQALSKDREFNFGLVPKVFLGVGRMIDALINSGVSRYLEFKTIDSVHFHLTAAPAGQSLWKVPCSKNDIFNTKQLSALEKRALMKFHQMVADWGRASAGTDVKVLNETELAVGRSLYRPQNKVDVHGGQVDVKDEKPFADLMQEYKLSAKLQALIQYGLCFHGGTCNEEEVYRSGDALRDLSLHINSLGKYSETALLACMYGSSEVVQGFCRMSAVWGSTFVLRRAARSLSYADKWTVTDDEGGVFHAPAVVVSGHAVSHSHCLDRMLLQVSVLCVGLVQPSERSIAIIPPGFAVSRDGQSSSMDNAFAVRVLQADASTGSTPEGVTAITVSTAIYDPLAKEDSSMAGWKHRAAALQDTAKALADRIKAAVFLDIPSPPVIIKLTCMLTPLTALSMQAHANGAPLSLAVTGSADLAALHMEGEVAQAEHIVRSLLGLERLFEEQQAEDGAGEYGAAAGDEDDEMHMLNQALQMASKPTET